MNELTDFVKEFSCRNKDLRVKKVFSVTNSNGFMPSADYFSKDVFSNDLSNYKIVRKGMLAYNPSRINVGSVACLESEDEVIVSPLYVVVAVDETRLLAEYLDLFLHSDVALRQIRSLTSGSVRDSLKYNAFTRLKLPIPSIDQQKSVIHWLSQVKTIISTKNRQLQGLDQLAKSRFIELFGDCPNPQTFPVVKLANIAEKISDGVHAKPEYTPTGKPFLSVVNIVKGFVDFSDCKYVSEDAYRKMIRSTHPQRGDVLYTKVGATYGVPAYVDTERDFCLYVSVCLIKPDHSKVNSRFLAFSMKMPYVKRQADAKIKGIGVPDLHLNQIRDFDIILPAYDKQNDFVAFIEELDKSKLAAQQLEVAA